MNMAFLRSWIVVSLLLLALAVPGRADFTFGEAVNLGLEVNSSTYDEVPSISADGLTLYFNSSRSGGHGNFDLWMTTRPTKDSPWGPPENLGPAINSPAREQSPKISTDGLSLYFNSNRSGNYTTGAWGDIWVTRRITVSAPWGTPVNLGPVINSPAHVFGPSISSDGLSLFFGAEFTGGLGNDDIWISTRATPESPWQQPMNLGPMVNSSAHDGGPSISADGLVLFFSGYGMAPHRSGGYGNADIWMTRRSSVSDSWGGAVNLGPTMNTSSYDFFPCIAADGSTLYFMSDRPGGYGNWDLWQAPLIPIVDFNSDGQVDTADMALLVANWGKSQALCDIGPLPWGDGVVDEQDLRILMESLMTPRPEASDVPCSVVLSWISPSFAQSCDVYFGTSHEAVKTASRTNPQGVLASQGQTATTYDPPGLLDFSKTYYWRVDFVISSPAPAIYQGPVLEFTTEAYARPIKSITATASSFQRNMEPAKTVDGSGLDKNDGHSTTSSDMWLSQGTQPNWIQYAFDQVHTLHELWVWNQNQAVEPFIGFGAKTVKIEYSTDGTTWTPLANVPEFARAPGKSDYVHNTTVPFGGVSAKYVKLTIEKGWGATPSVGLSEVRFFYIPERPAAKP